MYIHFNVPSRTGSHIYTTPPSTLSELQIHGLRVDPTVALTVQRPQTTLGHYRLFRVPNGLINGVNVDRPCWDTELRGCGRSSLTYKPLEGPGFLLI